MNDKALEAAAAWYGEHSHVSDPRQLVSGIVTAYLNAVAKDEERLRALSHRKRLAGMSALLRALEPKP